MKKDTFSLEKEEYFKACRDAKMALLNAVANPSRDAEIALQEHRFIIARLLNIVNGGTSLTAKTMDRVTSAFVGFLASLISLAIIVSVEPLRGFYATLSRLVGSEVCIACCHLVFVTAVGGYALWKLHVLSMINMERKCLSGLLGRIDKKQAGDHLEEYYALAVDDARSVMLASRSYSSSNIKTKLQNRRKVIAYLLDEANRGAWLDDSKRTYTLTAICIFQVILLYGAILELLGLFAAISELFKSEWVRIAALLIVALAVAAIGSVILGTLITATVQSNRRRTLSNLLKQIDDELNRV